MIFFTSDLHFGHAGIIKHSKRPFSTVEEMDAVLIRNWNQYVSKRDEVYILGDFTMGSAKTAYMYLSNLKGRKYFIRGNHDRFLAELDGCENDLDIEWVKDYYVLSHKSVRYVLFHYPILEWDGYFNGAVHLYGHVHNSKTTLACVETVNRLAINVGVDVNNYYPLSIDDIEVLIQAIKEKPDRE
ncbi:MAG: metallophosphoesterase [Synergistaceae bacterium]|jgi:calcineurin-like phosphoesterase family protein|nr:metallophosphoesterase [Synergistaceae bacterium]